MRINIVGGGPAGLFFALLIKKLDPSHEIAVYERDPADNMYGWGIVLSERSLATLRGAPRVDESGLMKPKAYVVLKEGVAGSDELARQLIDYCRANMAEYKRPRWIEFVDELPKTATGKIQRFKLRP